MTSSTTKDFEPAFRQTDTSGNGILAGDILYGADEIAVFLFEHRRLRRRVYNLVEQNALPVFRIGANICARKSILLAWIAAQERESTETD